VTDESFELDELAPGLRGYTVEKDGALYIPFFIAEERGKGTLTRYLDDVESRHKVVKIPTVLGERLALYLQRRGYIVTHEWAAEVSEWAEIWVKSSP